MCKSLNVAINKCINLCFVHYIYHIDNYQNKECITFQLWHVATRLQQYFSQITWISAELFTAKKLIKVQCSLGFGF